MLRYRLDDLGWYQFEWLIQSLLKAEISPAIESWGGRGDHGRDAYYPDSLPFPIKHLPSNGPFIFQVKFVENANAAGAKSEGALLDAVRKEASQIIARRSASIWADPEHFIVYTNAPLSPGTRERIDEVIRGAMPSTSVHSFGGGDVCDLLDKHSGLRRSFPQLLGLRDLDQLLLSATNKASIERSRRAIESARDLCTVFVPTAPYERAWRILRKHHFAVLEGPPEMGKTAIAWIIALSQIANGWEGVVGDDPDDFFRRIDADQSQVFIADDAFGRTEYDPARGLKWERSLASILRSVDAKHWLIWTSRKHILERALKAMDMQVPRDSFPNPAAILVDASRLSEKEKALILYRHARATKLEGRLKAIVRENAATIVRDTNFTPERIRRFVKEVAPELLSTTLKQEDLKNQIKEAIRNPTDRMRKAFKALAPAHKWFLIALLEVGLAGSADVIRVYEEHCPVDALRPGNEVFDELRESFVKGGFIVDWIHPSYRDLVIEELGQDEAMKIAFLERMSLPGIQLAISDTGGASGKRSLPLMTSDSSWKVLSERCMKCLDSADAEDAAKLLHLLTSATSGLGTSESRSRLIDVVGQICHAVYRRWNLDGVVLSAENLRLYQEASVLVSPLPPVPNLTASWTAISTQLRTLLETDESFVFQTDALESWIKFISVVSQTEPRFLQQLGFPGAMNGLIIDVLDRLRDDVDSIDTFGEFDELSAQQEGLFHLGRLLFTLQNLFPNRAQAIEELRNQIRGAEEHSAAAAEEVRPAEPEDESYDSPNSVFDIEALFGDL